MDDLGNKLNRLIGDARTMLFKQGELAQLTYFAFEVMAAQVKERLEETLFIDYPVGWRPDNQPILSRKSYDKDTLLAHYHYLSNHELANNGVIRLVTIVEALLGDIVRAIVLKYPKKLGAKREIPLRVVLEAVTIEDVHIRATDLLLNDLSYKSPRDFAEEIVSLISINLIECAAFHRYMEMKATRDIHIHNRGVANETYVRKADTHARVPAGSFLPIDLYYFLTAYESCLQLTEWLEKRAHEQWHSSEFESSQLRLELKPVDQAATSLANLGSDQPDQINEPNSSEAPPSSGVQAPSGGLPLPES